MLSIPATKGFEIGSGFKGCEVPGSLHNDAFMQKAQVESRKRGREDLLEVDVLAVGDSSLDTTTPVRLGLEAKLAHAMLSIPATKGFEIGSGFKGCEVPGSLHNDAFT
jgi:chorismate synthase